MNVSNLLSLLSSSSSSSVETSNFVETFFSSSSSSESEDFLLFFAVADVDEGFLLEPALFCRFLVKSKKIFEVLVFGSK
jgi:hypothetical protein